MTKQLTRQEVEAVVERFADKTLSFGCMIDDKNHSPSQIMFVGHGIGQIYSGIQIGAESTYHFFNGYKNPEMKVIGHPIYLHTILDKAEVVLCWEEEERKDKIYEIWCLWYECGLSRSLQEIIQASGWEHTLTAQDEDSSIRKTEVLTSPEANALFTFLQEIL